MEDEGKDSPIKANTDVHSHLPENFETGSATCITPPRGKSRKKLHLQKSNTVKTQPNCKSPSPKRKKKMETSISPQKEEGTMMQEDVVKELDPTKVNIIEEKTGESHVEIKEGEAVHLQDASGSEEDVDVDVEEEDEEDLGVGDAKMGATNNKWIEDEVLSKFGQDKTVEEELKKPEHVVANVHEEQVSEVEVPRENRVATTQNDRKSESLQLLEQEQLLDEDKKLNEQVEEKSTWDTEKPTSVSSNEKAGVVNNPAPILDSAEAEMEDVSNYLEGLYVSADCYKINRKVTSFYISF